MSSSTNIEAIKPRKNKNMIIKVDSKTRVYIDQTNKTVSIEEKGIYHSGRYTTAAKLTMAQVENILEILKK